MEKGQGRKRRQARTREAIIQAAEEIIETLGPDALNMRDVAERIDYSASNLYEYFSGKEELLAAVVNEALIRLMTHVRRIAADLSPYERLQSYGQAYLQFARTHPQLYLLIFTRKGAQKAHSISGIGTSSPYDLLQEIVYEGISLGCFTPYPGFGLHEMTFGCWSLVHGIAMLRLTGQEMLSETSAINDEQILKCFIDGMYKR